MSPSVGWQGEPRNLAYRPRARLDEQGAARVSVRHPEAMGCVATHPPGTLCVHEIAQPRILEREQRRRTPELTQLEDAQFAVETRYPMEWASKRQAQAALRWAGKVREACRGLLGL